MIPTTADPAAWAAHQVGLSPDAAPAEVRAALLREVTRQNFVPPPGRQQAWRVLCAPAGARPPFPPEAQLNEEKRLRGAIDDFAASFFATPVEARRQRWQELSAACAFSPPLAARLAALEPGLGLDLPRGDNGDPRTEQLASHVAGLFVLAPAARAAQRQAVLRGMQKDIAGWEEVVRRFQAASPALAALEPTLLASVLGWREQQRRLAKVREGRQAARRPAPRPAAAPAASRSGGRAMGWVGVVLAVAVVRGCIAMNRTTTSFNAPPPQIPNVQFQNWDAIERQRKMIEDMQRIQRENEERARQLGGQPGEAKPWERPEGPLVLPGEAKPDGPQPRRP